MDGVGRRKVGIEKERLLIREELLHRGEGCAEVWRGQYGACLGCWF